MQWQVQFNANPIRLAFSLDSMETYPMVEMFTYCTIFDAINFDVEIRFEEKAFSTNMQTVAI